MHGRFRIALLLEATIVALAAIGILLFEAIPRLDRSPTTALAAQVGGIYTNTVADCLKPDSGTPTKTKADVANGNADGVTSVAELQACVVAAPPNPKYSNNSPAANGASAQVGASTEIQDATREFFGLFAGTNGNHTNVGGSSDGCILEQAVRQWATWNDANQDRVIVLDDGAWSRQCPAGASGDGTGIATKANIEAELVQLRTLVPGGGSFVLFLGGHAGGNRFVDYNGDDVTAQNISTWLSGFQPNVTMSVIIDACETGAILSDFATSKSNITDSNLATVNTANISMMTATDASHCTLGISKPTQVKPDGLGNLSGLFDINAGPNLYSCIARMSEDSTTLRLKSAAQCYSFFDTGFVGAEPPCQAVHAQGGGATPVVPGAGTCQHAPGGDPPPPPPYTYQPPAKFYGGYDASSDVVRQVGCFADIGGTTGPNVLMVLTIPNAKQQLQNGPVLNGTADLYAARTILACNNASLGIIPAGAPTSSIPATVTKVVNQNRDKDGDGCTDMQELWQLKTLPPTTRCGDDPWNPYDPTGLAPNLSGSYDLMFEKTRADVGQPGDYWNCNVDLQHVGKNVTARLLCYFDSPGVTVNPQSANCDVNPGAGCANGHVRTCPPAPAQDCGDGFSGAAPPGCAQEAQAPPATCRTVGVGCVPQPPSISCNISQYQFADIDDKQAVWTGTLDNSTNELNLAGCIEDRDGHGALGYVFVRATLDANTGLGYAEIITNLSTAGCLGGVPPSGFATHSLAAVRQALPATDRDSDGDGCPDKRELSDTPGGDAGGGLRDPLNRWDYFNPEKVNTPHTQTIADILKVADQYGRNRGNPSYTIDTDRTPLTGGNPWNLGPPEGTQSIIDILIAVKQYHQNC